MTRALVPGSKTSSSAANKETLQGKIHKYEFLFKQSEMTLREIIQFSNWINLDPASQPTALNESSIQTDDQQLPVMYSDY